jgi:quinolinate synthase
MSSAMMNSKFILCSLRRYRISPQMIKDARGKYKNALIMIHPEAPHECRVLADLVFSTGQMCDYVNGSSCKEFVIATETGILHSLKKSNPDKTFIPLSAQLKCPNMKKGNLLSVKKALEGNCGEIIRIDEDVSRSALISLKKMLELSI